MKIEGKEELLKEILEGISDYEDLKRKMEENLDTQTTMKKIERFLEEEGIICKDEKGKKILRWEKPLEMYFTKEYLPFDPCDYYNLLEFEEFLRLLDLAGVDFDVEISTCRYIEWQGEPYMDVFIGYELADQVADDFVTPGKRFEVNGYEIAEGVVEFLIPRAKKFFVPLLREARKRGWIYKDEHGKERFIWNRMLSKKDEIYKALKEIKEKGAERFLRIVVDSNDYLRFVDTCWFNNVLRVPFEKAEKVLGRTVYLGESLSVDEALSVFSFRAFSFSFRRRTKKVLKRRESLRRRSGAWGS